MLRLLEGLDLSDPRLKPSLKDGVVPRLTQCDKAPAHQMVAKMRVSFSHDRSCPMRGTTRKTKCPRCGGWLFRNVVATLCKHCGKNRSMCYEMVKAQVSYGVRGRISNHAFVALYLLKHGPSPMEVVRLALCEFRSRPDDAKFGVQYVWPEHCNGRDRHPRWSAPPGTATAYHLLPSHYWCGLVPSDATYWWCKELPKVSRKRNFSDLQLTSRGLSLAAEALATVAEALGQEKPDGLEQATCVTVCEEAGTDDPTPHQEEHLRCDGFVSLSDDV